MLMWVWGLSLVLYFRCVIWRGESIESYQSTIPLWIDMLYEGVLDIQFPKPSVPLTPKCNHLAISAAVWIALVQGELKTIYLWLELPILALIYFIKNLPALVAYTNKHHQPTCWTPLLVIGISAESKVPLILLRQSAFSALATKNMYLWVLHGISCLKYSDVGGTIIIYPVCFQQVRSHTSISFSSGIPHLYLQRIFQSRSLILSMVELIVE